MAYEEQFEQARKDVQTLSRKPGNDDLLYLYAHFKQGSVGDVTGKRPGMLDMVGRAKYDAWAKLKGMDQDTARQNYISKVEALRKSHG
ncbi:acyl-CoA-binding protein [Alloalcanivorax xenomutans]|jgi:diazepam-binding inhibitor (GABA receptor modulator, acyl-CoA-binding protein)|uniref:Acyl-CoA-binding protein n=1 Tax=Alloalcanivorax xenomutans TaxID=1094342 RepID=A0A9Q3W6C6_9GAMM|nr:acyl-CoA-binding protein [Alloalcanivorax xenomutans]ERS13946.1 acyl-CoA-binding protein [Alcanivorax sp. PN-3]KYZ87856.1 acyl-CoA-binding protein [Alcanivorax sp. KX64203]PHS60052.1 MAG: acyl-CoA-binding protein [Alcanivorax sp.]ARB45992.1 acyl-CoA-binding protein [Alloalcanivorax xenomutans]MCE7508632.1 acyl-CoA-binding protein [Alloalcanivorax xenomutans]